MVSDRCVLQPGVTVGRNAVLGSGTFCPKRFAAAGGSVWLGCQASAGGAPALRCRRRNLPRGCCHSHPALPDPPRPLPPPMPRPPQDGKPTLWQEGTKEAEEADTETPYARAYGHRQAPYFVWPPLQHILQNVAIAACRCARALRFLGGATWRCRGLARAVQRALPRVPGQPRTPSPSPAPALSPPPPRPPRPAPPSYTYRTCALLLTLYFAIQLICWDTLAPVARAQTEALIDQGVHSYGQSGVAMAFGVSVGMAIVWCAPPAAASCRRRGRWRALQQRAAAAEGRSRGAHGGRRCRPALAALVLPSPLPNWPLPPCCACRLPSAGCPPARPPPAQLLPCSSIPSAIPSGTRCCTWAPSASLWPPSGPSSGAALQATSIGTRHAREERVGGGVWTGMRARHVA